ncbi:MAG: ABC transporter ATP-binding protein [Brevinema sp.]
MGNIIEINNLTKFLRDRNVLNGLTVDIQESETFVLVGQSGTGKSVLLKHLTGLMYPDSGTIKIKGQDVSNYSEKEWHKVRTSIGMLFQNGAIFDSLTVGQNILFVLDHLAPYLSDSEKNKRVSYCLDVVGLSGLENTMPTELSGGMRKRAALARSIANKPDILLFDEPTTGLDPIMTALVDELILTVKQELGTTFIVVTHDMASAKRVADRIALLFEGRIVYIGSPKDLKTNSNPYMDQFLNGLVEGPMTKR